MYNVVRQAVQGESCAFLILEKGAESLLKKEKIEGPELNTLAARTTGGRVYGLKTTETLAVLPQLMPSRCAGLKRHFKTESAAASRS